MAPTCTASSTRSNSLTRAKVTSYGYNKTDTESTGRTRVRFCVKKQSILWLAFSISGVLASDSDAQDAIDFTSQIRPILADNCYACHGPDDNQRATDLRLDQQASALQDLGGYTAIEPGDPQASELVARIHSDDPDFVMPPSGHLKKLTPEQRQLLTQWIAEGANWTEHWSFQPLQPSPSPQNEANTWPRNFIDHHILAKLESAGIDPAPPAARNTLIRRLSSDLNGLPPDQALLDLAQQEPWPQTYEELVDRLLASDAFGERMATYWLDLVRYADSVGYHGDQPVSVSPYRDYVIDAFNRNLPFDQFTLEQLAGDLIEDSTAEQKIASGYNRLGMMSAEGGVQPEEYLAKYASDRVRTTASVWLGITLGCAECHDHKFDPLTTREFYEFQAFFADIKERGLYAGAHQSKEWGPTMEVPDEVLPELLSPLDGELSALAEQIRETDAVKQERLAWEQQMREANYHWQTLKPLSAISTHPTEITIQADDAILVGGENPAQNTYVITADLPPDTRAFRIEALPHASLPKQGPGRAGNGNFVVSELTLLLGDQSASQSEFQNEFAKWPKTLRDQALKLEHPTATIEQVYGGESHPDKKWSAASAFDRDARGKTWGWAVLPEVGKPQELVVRLAAEAAVPKKITFVLQQLHQNGTHTLGHFRLSTSTSPFAVANPLDRLPTEIAGIIETEPSQRTVEQQAAISDYFLTIAPSLKSIHQKIAELQKRRQQLVEQHTRTSLITVAVPPREIRVLPRGNWMDRSGDVVTPNVPAVLGRPEWDHSPTRLDLARWLTAPDNPLTARVFVNRIWKLLFGAGLAPVLDDFGAQGQAPSHPELLDHLAIEFQQSGWDIKHLIKTIVMSQTYQQSSALRSDLTEVDPENRLLARQARFRIEAEFIRDHALVASGLLVNKIGGRSVKPYQPAGLYQHLNFPKRTYQADSGEDQYRRGLYTHWQRQYLHPAMKIFDAPAREECTAARPQSSTPLAALVLLNDPSYVESARAMATRVLHSDTDSDARLNQLFLISLGRPIRVEEQKVLKDLLANHQRYYSDHPEEAKQLLSIGNHPRDESLPTAEHAAWTSVCRTVINLHEFVTRF